MTPADRYSAEAWQRRLDQLDVAGVLLALTGGAMLLVGLHQRLRMPKRVTR